MLQLKTIRDEKQRILSGLRKRNWTSQQLKVVDNILLLDENRRSGQKLLDDFWPNKIACPSKSGR